jgi:hypothetical protein
LTLLYYQVRAFSYERPQYLNVRGRSSVVLAWLGLKATGFGLASGGFGFWITQAKPEVLALAWLWLGLAWARALGEKLTKIVGCASLP